MGTQKFFDNLSNQVVSESGILPSAEYRQRMQTLIAQHMSSRTPEQLYQMLARLVPVAPRRFTAEEQAARRQRSEQVREAVIDDTLWNRMSTSAPIGPIYHTLLDRSGTEEARRYNEQLTALFRPRSSQELAQYRQERIEAHVRDGMTQQQAEQTAQDEIDSLPARRGTALLEALSRYERLTSQQLEEMSDPNLPGEQLAQNYRELHHGSTMIMELDAMLRGNDIALTEEQRARVTALQNRQQEFAKADISLINISNPYHEYMDINDLLLLDDTALSAQYAPDDNFSEYIGDLPLLKNCMIMQRETAVKQFLSQQLGITGDDVRMTKADPAAYAQQDADLMDLQDGAIVAVEQGDQACILFADHAPGSTGVITDRPGRLFDNRLNEDMNALIDQLDRADPPLLRSSREFKNMKKQLETLGKMGALGDRPTPYQREQMQRQLETLQQAAADYLATKGEQGKNQREQRRMDVASAIQQFTAHKLEQLGLVAKSQNTLTLDQQRERAAWGGLRTGETAQQKRSEPYAWLENQCAAYPEDMAALKGAAADSIQNLRAAEARYQQDLSERRYDTTSNYKHCRNVIGSMALMELLRQERSQTPEGQTGPLAQHLAADKDRASRLAEDLGKRLISQAAQRGLISSTALKNDNMADFELEHDDVRRLMDSFDPQKLPAGLLADEQARAAERDAQEKAQAAAREREQLLRQAPPIAPLVHQQGMHSMQCMRAAGSPLSPKIFASDMETGLFGSTRFDALCEQGEHQLAATAGREMLRDMVLYDMLVQERVGRGKNSEPGPMETLVFSEDGLSRLRQAVETSKEFAPLAAEDMNKPRMKELLTARAPQKVAQQLLQTVKAAARQAEIGAQQQRRQGDPEKQLQPPQSRQPAAPSK